eukprot:983319-Rhodomonas_salina.1
MRRPFGTSGIVNRGEKPPSLSGLTASAQQTLKPHPPLIPPSSRPSPRSNKKTWAAERGTWRQVHCKHQRRSSSGSCFADLRLHLFCGTNLSVHARPGPQAKPTPARRRAETRRRCSQRGGSARGAEHGGSGSVGGEKGVLDLRCRKGERGQGGGVGSPVLSSGTAGRLEFGCVLGDASRRAGVLRGGGECAAGDQCQRPFLARLHADLGASARVHRAWRRL